METATSIRESDLVIQDLAAENVLLHERIVHLESQQETYRELAKQAIHAVHSVTAERDRTRHENRLLRSEIESVRAVQQSRGQEAEC